MKVIFEEDTISIQGIPLSFWERFKIFFFWQPVNLVIEIPPILGIQEIEYD